MNCLGVKETSCVQLTLKQFRKPYPHTVTHAHAKKETHTSMYICIHLAEGLMGIFCNVFANFLQMSNYLKI